MNESLRKLPSVGLGEGMVMLAERLGVAIKEGVD